MSEKVKKKLKIDFLKLRLLPVQYKTQRYLVNIHTETQKSSVFAYLGC